MKHIFTLLFIFILAGIQAQHNAPSGLRNMGPLSQQDADVLSYIEEATISDEYRGLILPDSIDNSQREWFRPIFSQTFYPNCMQSTSIAYNFTYEMCRLRGLSALNEDNQYGPHFSWNFFNGGNGWYGVNYLQTMDVLKYHGTPTVTDYGGFYNGGGERWMSGYDEWYSAMNNRISGIRKIYTGNEEGILTLKHWIANHLDGSETGGVASFIANSPYSLQNLPEGTPQAGKKVLITWLPNATHGMTIVGYNDSIRWDYNNDGQYTNDLDINGDGYIDAHDWEFGAFKFANSHGVGFGDSGFAYMMYKTLVDDFEHGGIWASTVHILDVKEEHHTPMTFRVSMDHDKRDEIRVQVGISSNLESSVPEHIHSYTILNYQGDAHYMQGIDIMDEYKTLEFGLDISPLLSYTEPGNPYKFFLLIDERDPKNLGTGQVNYFSLIDYSDGIQEIVCNQLPAPLVENSRTYLSVIHTPEVEGPSITTTELPLYEAGQMMEVQLQASGGKQPYSWALDRNYTMGTGSGGFPDIDENQIMIYGDDENTVVQELEFSFPFYGNTFDSVIVSSKGYIAFDKEMYFWPYIVDHEYLLKNLRVVAPFLSRDLQIFHQDYSGVWYEGDANKATFRWEAGIFDGTYGGINFAVTLYPNGNIQFHYGEISIDDPVDWIVGISDGDFVNHSLPMLPEDAENISNETLISFSAPHHPEEIQLTADGVMSIMESNDHSSAAIKVHVTDDNNVSAEKTFQFSDGLELNMSVAETASNKILSGSNNTLDIVLRNRTSSSIYNIDISAICDDPLIIFTDGLEHVEQLGPGETLQIPAAFTCNADINLLSGAVIPLLIDCRNDLFVYEYQHTLQVEAPAIQLKQYSVLTETGILESGEEAVLEIEIVNLGLQPSINTWVNLRSPNPGIHIEEAGPVALGDIPAGGSAMVEFELTADFSFDNGSDVSVMFDVRDEAGRFQAKELQMSVGKLPVCVVDMDPGTQSGPQIYELLQQMEVNSMYITAFPESFLSYQAVILCLGTQFSFHELNYNQATALRDFLNQGGDLYMEGRNIWKQDDIDFLLEKFNINTAALPGLYPVIEGIDSTFTEGLAFETTMVQPISFFHLDPISPAYPIFRGTEPYPYNITVAYDAGTYQTVAMVFELGAMMSSDTSNLADFMQGMLDFFGVVQNTLSIEELPQGELLTADQNYPNPFSSSTQIPLELKERSKVEAAVYDLQGRKIYDIQQPSMLEKGNYVFRWNADDSYGNPVPGGIYIYRINVDGNPRNGKMILIR